MATRILPRSRETSEAAERQMRTWALQLETARRLEEHARAEARKHMVKPYIAISRESGVDGGEVGRAVAERLGWKVLDRELLDYMAENYEWSRVALEYVDEKTASWFHDTLGKWLDEKLVSQPEFVRSLSKIVSVAARNESTVFVGRGAQFILPREEGLCVRIIAPKEQRIARVMNRLGHNKLEAEQFIETTDAGRANFVQRYFLRDVADPHLYDLVVNLAHFSSEAAVELILEGIGQIRRT